MLYTVTLNPSLDYVMKSQSLFMGRVNRSEEESINFGGKGLNVSAILKELGLESVALGFVAGFSGQEICRLLQNSGITSDFVMLKSGFSRINVKLRHGTETDINASGPEVARIDVEELLEKIKKINSNDFVVLSGSAPSVCDMDLYDEIANILTQNKVNFVLDVSGGKLIDVSKYKPFLLKPNTDELGEAFGVQINDALDVQKYALMLKEQGAQNVLVSMAAEGALLADSNGEIHKVNAIKGKAVNSVGAGDSMVAGFVAGYIKTKDYDYALKLGTAAGGATAFSEGLAKGEEIMKLLNMQNY